MKLIKALLLIAVISACKEPVGHRLGEMSEDPLLADHNQTKIVKSDDIQVAFDLMSMPYHKQMMKLMKADMKHTEGETHGLMLTIMDYETKETIKHARVSITVQDPAGQAKTVESEIMSGAGMHHYAMHLKAKESGEYRVNAIVKARNKIYRAGTTFKIDRN